MNQFTISNPKRQSGVSAEESVLYPYYPGFSDSFARSLIESANLEQDSVVLDPWNGSGTTTTAAVRAGVRTYGFDLNPVMVIVAKAHLVNPRSKASLRPLAADLIYRATKLDSVVSADDEPLLAWFGPTSAQQIRRIEQAIQCVLVDEQGPHPLALRCTYGGLSDLAAFYYTALFKTVKTLLAGFLATNPTWIKKPKSSAYRLRPSTELINKMFKSSAVLMIKGLGQGFCLSRDSQVDVHIDVASSDSLPLPDRFVDLIVTSPPYCTRIDYAVATSPELAVLGYRQNVILDNLRNKMIGTSTVRATVPTPPTVWGKTCLEFLKNMIAHKSKASATYYYKNHVQYFQAIYASLSELHRCTKNGGRCVIVVQDSFYKELHNDVPRIIVEMGESSNFTLERRADFPYERTMARLHPGVRKYRNKYGGVESVICFKK